MPLGLGATAQFLPITIPTIKAPVVKAPKVEPVTPGASAAAAGSGEDSSASAAVTGGRL